MDLGTILADSAAQTDRATPVDYRIQTQNWQSPGEEWFEAFSETVVQQFEEAQAFTDTTIEGYRAEVERLKEKIRVIERLAAMPCVEGHIGPFLRLSSIRAELGVCEGDPRVLDSGKV